MKSLPLINILELVLLLAVIAAVVVILWNSIPGPAVLTTVSWNG